MTSVQKSTKGKERENKNGGKKGKKEFFSEKEQARIINTELALS